MDGRGWLWKKKSSNKTGSLKALDCAEPATSSLASVASLQDQGSKKGNYVQVPLDTCTRLTGLKDEVKNWQSQAKDLEEQLSAVKLEITAKDNLATQHSKVAEEAVSGWEKAVAEASALKNQVASVSLLKLAAEDRASHLDSALKACMIQLRVAKEEHHEKMNEVILTKNKQCDKIKTDLESKITELEQKLLRSVAEKAALSRSLQEHSTMLMRINDEKSQVEVENELLKRDVQSREKEINSLKYEVHVVTKELDIRNEEKDMSVKSTEAANKQYLDSAKKITKLETECQRLRCFVKKKLPSPAALAQMKLEVENWAHESSKSRSIPDKIKNTKSYSPSLPDIHTDNVRPDHRDIELLMKRLLGTEEEMNMLKEALAKRNSELQFSRDSCDKMVVTIKILQMQVQILNQHKNSPRSIFECPNPGSSPNASDPQSVTSLSEDGLEDDGRSSESRSKNSVTDTSIDLMDDFLEMEKIARTKNSSKNSTSQAFPEGTLEINGLSPGCSKLGINAQNIHFIDPNLVDTVSDSEHEVPTEGNLAILTEIEQLNVEKDNMAKELARLNQDLESKNLKLEELDLQLTEARSELEYSRKWNGLAETQLKCMAESYKLLETRAQELEENVKFLQVKIESLDAMLEEEKRGHDEALARVEDLQDQIHRKKSCQAYSSLESDFDVESKKGKEIENAAAKLAECQETIFLLGKQLKTLHNPQTEVSESQHNEKLQKNETSAKDKLAQSFRSPQSRSFSNDFENNNMGRASSFNMRVIF